MAQREDIPEQSKFLKLDVYQNLKAKIHRKLIERLDFSSIDLIDQDILGKENGNIIERTGPSKDKGGMMAFTLEPSGRRAST